jgi:septum formation protein
MAKLLLASGSPRRRELLSLLGVPFEVVTPRTQEEILSGEDPNHLALRLARMKAEEVARTEEGKSIVAADTVVVVRGQVVGKPADAIAASAILTALRQGEHRVISGLAVFDPVGQGTGVEVVETMVWMRSYANVMGLPLCHLYLKLEEMGFPLRGSPRRACEAYSGQVCLVATEILKRDNH